MVTVHLALKKVKSDPLKENVEKRLVFQSTVDFRILAKQLAEFFIYFETVFLYKPISYHLLHAKMLCIYAYSLEDIKNITEEVF